MIFLKQKLITLVKCPSVCIIQGEVNNLQSCVEMESVGAHRAVRSHRSKEVQGEDFERICGVQPRDTAA